MPVTLEQKKGEPQIFSTDEHPRPDTTLEALARLKPVVKPEGTVTAGNASGINDGSCALLLASESAARKYELTPRVRSGRHRCRGRGAAHHGIRPRARHAQSPRKRPD